MAIRIIKIMPEGMKICISLLCLLILLLQAAYSQDQKLSVSEFQSELRKTLASDNEQLTISLIKNHRLFVKQFVDGLIRESIFNELEGKHKESEVLEIYAKETAEIFEKIFGERSLTIAVNYLTSWNNEQKSDKLLADSKYAVGTKYRVGNNPEEAIEAYNSALDIYSIIGDERGEAEVLGGLGAVYFNNCKDYESSLKYYRNALIKREKVDDKQLIASTLNSLGSVYKDYLEDYPEALFYYNKAEVLREEIGDNAGLKTTLSYKAAVFIISADLHKNSGNYSEALEDLDKALQIRTNVGEVSRVAETLSQIGFIYSKLGDYTTAFTRLSEAERMMKEVNDETGLAGIYNHYGIVLNDAGRPEKAIEYYSKALKIYEENNDMENSLPVLNNMANIFQVQKEYAAAGELYSRGLTLTRQTNSRINEADFLLNMANNQIFQKKLSESMSNYLLAQSISDSLGNFDLRWRILVGMAENFEQRGEFDETQRLNDSALQIIDKIRISIDNKELRATYLAKERIIFEDIIDLLARRHEKEPGKGYDSQAFRYSEQSKSRVLLDLLSESGKGQLHNNETVTLEEAKSLCPDNNTLILNYFVGDSSTCLWAITKTDNKLFILSNRKVLQEKIEALRFVLQDREQSQTDFFSKASIYLYDLMLRPAEAYLKKNTKIIVIPDGIINYLPFEVLLTESKAIKTTGKYSDLPFLIKKYPVSYVQSVSVLRNLISSASATPGNELSVKKLLAFGDPVYEQPGSISIKGRPYARLKYSGEEVRKIASLFETGKSDIFLRENATEENVRKAVSAGNYTYMHFASHGYINENKPDLSSLVLSKSEDSAEDGLLQSSEIFNLKLKTDLVALSACQTGLGKLVHGEGIIGLTRAFMSAGAPSVLVSLWSVSDNSTSILMESFYSNLIKSRLDKTDSLRKAKLFLLSSENLAHPFYWAPFVLVGDWR